LASLGHPFKFQRVSRLGSVTARHSSSGRQPNCGVEQRAPPVIGRASITLGIGSHSSCVMVFFHTQRTQHELHKTMLTRMWANARRDGRRANVGGALCSTPQTLADARYSSAVQ